MSARSKAFTFTINNYNESTLTTIRNIPSWDKFVYICFQKEVGASGTPHLQGYIQLSTRVRFTQVKDKLGGRAHLEDSRGSDQDNYIYCSKEGGQEFTEIGERIEMGRKKRKRDDEDYSDLITYIKEGHTERQIIERFPELCVKNMSSVKYIMGLYKKKPLTIYNGPWLWTLPELFTWDKTLILVGDSGIGKTEWAKSLMINPLFVTHIDDLKRFDCNEHGGIIFDDMSFTQIPRTAAIHLVDNDNPRSIHIRYGRAEIPQGTKKIITSNLHEIFPEDTTGAIARRCFYMDL